MQLIHPSFAFHISVFSIHSSSPAIGFHSSILRVAESAPRHHPSSFTWAWDQHRATVDPEAEFAFLVQHRWPIDSSWLSEFGEYPHPETSSWTGHRLSLIADGSDCPYYPTIGHDSECCQCISQALLEMLQNSLH